LNFVNSSSVTVSVSSGTAGNANISFISSNQFYSGLSTNPLTKIESSGRMLEWTHNRDYTVYLLPVGSATPSGVFAKPDGTRLYVTDSTSDLIYQIPLSEAWNLAAAGTVTSYSVSAVETSATDLSIKNDGSTLYLLGDTGNDITWFDVPTAWDVTSITGANSTFSVVSQTGTPAGFFIRSDGTKFWVVGGTTTAAAVYAYSMATAWNMATATYDSVSFVVGTLDTSPQSISFSSDGKYMWIVGNTGDALYEYLLGTAWDISTAAFTGNFRNIRDAGTGTGFSFETSPTGIFVSTQNNRMYLVGSGEDSVIEYKTNEGVTIEAEVLAVTGKGSFNDDLWIRGDVFATEAMWALDGIVTGSTGQYGLSAAGALTSATLNAVVFNGSVNSTGNSAITIGTGTSNTETNVAIGATLAGSVKNVRIGSGGLSGSITNITVGPVGVDANVNVNANTATFSNTVNIANQLIVSGLNIINELAIADNTVRVSVNSASTLSNKYLNFVNTATVTVSVTDAGDGNANIAFTSTSSPGSGVTSVATGLGLTGGPITSTGTISANIASITVQGITKLIDAVNSNDAANAARVTANSGSAQSAVSLNFINTHNIIVSVGAGVAGTANVGFTVNTSKIIFVGTTAPSSPAIGDLWVDTN
jgi:hypothetical protein